MVSLSRGELRDAVAYGVLTPALEVAKDVATVASNIGRKASFFAGSAALIGLQLLLKQPDPAYGFASPAVVDPETGELKWGCDFLEDDASFAGFSLGAMQ